MTELLALALVGHLIGDWIVQTDWQARWKAARSWYGTRALAGHMLGYHITLGLVVALAAPSIVKLAILLAVSLVTHAFIDLRWPVVKLLQWTRSYQFANQMWGVLVVDQVLHISILIVLVTVLW